MLKNQKKKLLLTSKIELASALCLAFEGLEVLGWTETKRDRRSDLKIAYPEELKERIFHFVTNWNLKNRELRRTLYGESEKTKL